MYGTMARMRVKPGKAEELRALGETWSRERKPKVAGAVASYMLIPDSSPNELVLLAVFQDQATYRANAADPEQDRWYQRIRALLEADPVWTDGEIVET